MKDKLKEKWLNNLQKNMICYFWNPPLNWVKIFMLYFNKVLQLFYSKFIGNKSSFRKM